MKRKHSNFRILSSSDYKDKDAFTMPSKAEEKSKKMFVDAVNKHLRNGWVVVSYTSSDYKNQEGRVALVKEIWTD